MGGAAPPILFLERKLFMPVIRISVPEDIPVQRELWALAFGDAGAYVDNFYENYYRPERVLVLEENGIVRAMTAWFDTSLAVPGRKPLRAAYLYAVATHPDVRGRGFSGQLLSWADEHFRSLGFDAVTTVPAQPSLHHFFARNGFQECFTHDQRNFVPAGPVSTPSFVLDPVSPARYGELRELLLADLPHITYPLDALTYQAGCCHVSGGGLYAADTGYGLALLCAEGTEDGRLLLKELLGMPEAQHALLAALPALLPNFSGIYRIPGEKVPFGMLKILNKPERNGWNWQSNAYLGLAFD